MSMFACGCGSNAKNKRRAKSMTNSELYLYKQKFRFAENELLEFRQRFTFLANAEGLIDKPSFMESMGVLGLDQGSFLSDRIFQVIDNNGDGYIRLEEYLNYFDILIYGSQEEKYELTFKMIDTERKGWFRYDQFYEMIMSMLQTWNNITGNNYNIHENRKLEHFLETAFRKFDITRSDKVTLNDFKRAVSKEPKLLEIFDYFNEGIIDTVQPISEFEQQNQELIQELERLHSKVQQLKALVRSKGNHAYDEIQTNLNKERSPKTAGLRHDEARVNSPGRSTSPQYERKPSMLQSLDTKIRKTALFEHLRRDSEGEDDVPLSMSVSKPRSAIIRPESNRLVNFKTETMENIMKSEDLDMGGKKSHAGSSRNVAKFQRQKRNTLDRALESTPARMKKPIMLGDFQTSPEGKDGSNQLSSSARLNGSEQPVTLDQIEQMPNQGQDKKQEEEKNADSPSINREIAKHNNLGVIKEEKTFTLDTIKASELKIKTNILIQEGTAQNFPLKLSGDTFVGVLLESQRPGNVPRGTPRKDGEIEEENPNELGSDRKVLNHMMSGAKQQRPDTVMVEPKVLELDDIEVFQSKLVSEPVASGLKPKFQLEDVKLTDSFVVHSGESSRFDPVEGHRASSKSLGPNLKVIPSRIDVNDHLKHGHEDEKYHHITMQIDVIAEETLRIIEEIHQKRRNAGRVDKNNEVKKIEQMKEVTAHNIHKTTKHKAKKGHFVSFGHQNWNLVLNMMLGIQVAVKSAVERPETLTMKDFNVKYVFELIPKRTSEMKDAYKICKFFDYAPSIFLEIRKYFGIKNEDYLKSIGPESMLNGLIKGNLDTLAELTSSGKSGSFFYYSADGKYTLKTISRDEFHFLRKILSNYYNHIMNNPNTLMIKFFGLHKVRFMKGPQRKAKLYIIIMANVFNTSREIHVRYDLKGSTQGRITRDEDPTIALKDLNIIEKKEKIVLTKEVADTFVNILEKDAHFFEENSIIDYSLLMGVHHLEHDELSTKEWSSKKIATEFKMQAKEGVLSGDGSKIYFFGVIDILTQFNAKKRAEYMVKRIAYGKGISAVPPPTYAKRFITFIKSLVKTPETQAIAC